MASPLALDCPSNLSNDVCNFFVYIVDDLKAQMVLAMKKIKGPDGKVLQGEGAGYVLPGDNQKCGYCFRRGHGASICPKKLKDEEEKAKKARLASTFPSSSGEPATLDKVWLRIKNFGGLD